MIVFKRFLNARMAIAVAGALLLLLLVAMPNSAEASGDMGWGNPYPYGVGGMGYVVQKGDTLTSIALQYGVTVGALMQANMITNPNVIYVGQRLIIPGSAGMGGMCPGTVYVVKQGETLSQIAYYYGYNYWNLAYYNGIANPNYVQAGQSICLP
jgi:LysM repeat protein